MTKLDPVSQREFAVEVVEHLQAAGHQAYWAGGCVRDQLLGRAPKDYDVATSALPAQIRALFGPRRTLPLGAAFGVITVLGPKSAGPIEVATFRQDAGYSDGRHPDAVEFSTAEADAQRRDFTINGLFYDPHSRAVIDYVAGQQDLHAGVVRAIGDPQARFAEDKLRLLRAVRFAAHFDFQIEPETRRALIGMADQIHAVSAERIANELRLILVSSQRRRGVELLAETGLLASILPEIAAAIASRGSAEWDTTLRTLAWLHEPSFPLALAALLHRVASPENVCDVALRLKLANAELKRAEWLVANHAALEQARATHWPRLQRLLIAPGSGDLIELGAAIAHATAAGQQEVDYCRGLLSLPAAELNPPPLIRGNDLIAHGVPQGPEYQRLLEAVRDAQLDKLIETRTDALRLVDRLRSTQQPPA